MTYALELQGLTKIYSNGVKALNGISLQVEQGDFYALLGPNGAGKSTIIGIISSLVNKTNGKVAILGHDLDKQLIQAKLRLGVVPQEFNFNQFETVLQIMVNQAGCYGISRKQALLIAEQNLKELELWEKKDQPARRLSGGMKRRLMIARALMHRPKILILDEPTAGVDIELRRSMWSFLQRLNQSGVTIILTTHYLEEAEVLCRNIGIIMNGYLIENTSMKSLLSQLSSETFVLDVSNISQIQSIQNYRLNIIDQNTLEVEVLCNQGLNDLFEQLTRQGVSVLSMRNKANRLEELFVNLINSNRS